MHRKKNVLFKDVENGMLLKMRFGELDVIGDYLLTIYVRGRRATPVDTSTKIMLDSRLDSL